MSETAKRCSCAQPAPIHGERHKDIYAVRCAICRMWIEQGNKESQQMECEPLSSVECGAAFAEVE
ncbi:MAG: hypothetical protein LBV73_27390 [Paraburkholderia sp.]|jgi:hypothetical protein|nr:hypothetical protein [Paraburkholderia sp.]